VTKSSVFVVDDHPIVAQGLRRVLASTPDLYVIGDSASITGAMTDVQRLQPDLVVLDLRLGDQPGTELCRKIVSILPTVKVVILTGFSDASLLGVCLECGARAVALKSSSELDLVATLRRVRDGEIVIDPSIQPELSSRREVFESHDTDGSMYERLRPREYAVLRLVARGLSTREIATDLGLSTNTVRSYLQSLMSKLHVHSRVQLVIAARRLRLI
jgi:DNA-binding NarL/FixJ family response regulator